tara:strand:- start:62 stop:469 length:408 start_codon:yes stop_codon:yes gene_type:complete
MKDNKFEMSPREWRNKHLTEAKVPDAKSASKVMWKKMLELGLNTKADYRGVVDKAFDGGRGESITKIKIDPKTLGAMAPMFKSVNLETSLLAEVMSGQDLVMVIGLKYDYQHPSGSNGYSITYRYTSSRGKWEQY